MKSTLFPFTELDGDRLESCCGVLDIERVSCSDQMITGRGWEHHILMVPYIDVVINVALVDNKGNIQGTKCLAFPTGLYTQCYDSVYVAWCFGY
jgi:hypothetical protein